MIPVPKNLMSKKEFGLELGTKIKTFSDDDVKLLFMRRRSGRSSTCCSR